MRRNYRAQFLKSIWILLIFFSFGCSQKASNGIADNRQENSPGKIPSEAVHALENNEDLDVLLEAIGDAELVLLGEASHGTSEFYTWRAEISRRLIQEKGFTIIAVEGDWTDALPLNNYIKGNNTSTSAVQALEGFDRWPSWMWANEEIRDFAEWLHNYNKNKTGKEQVGFYGLDVYGIWESLQEVHKYLLDVDPSTAEASKAVITCFAAYNKEEMAYARATKTGEANCEAVISEMVDAVEDSVEDLNALTTSEFNALQNAYVVANAETYYRTAVRSYPGSWNVRDHHMTGTINRLLEYYGQGTKIIIWEHNTHVGDARATDMADDGMINVGQLARENHGNENVYIIGFGTYRGKVIAAERWGVPPQVMTVPPAQRNSWEWMLHREEPEDMIIFMDQLRLIPRFKKRIGHRAIGVVYDPDRESGNYVPSVLPERYDAFIFIDKTTALKPISK